METASKYAGIERGKNLKMLTIFSLEVPCLKTDSLLTIMCNHLNIPKKCLDFLRNECKMYFPASLYIHTMACTKRMIRDEEKLKA